MGIRAQFKNAIRGFDNFAYKNRIYIPAITMVGTTAFFATSQEYSLLFSGSFIIGSGLGAFTGVKLAEGYVKLRAMLDTLNKDILPQTQETLKTSNNILPKAEDILNGILHPGQSLHNKVHSGVVEVGSAVSTTMVDVGNSVSDTAELFFDGLTHLLGMHKHHHKNSERDLEEGESHHHHSTSSIEDGHETVGRSRGKSLKHRLSGRVDGTG